MAKKKEDIVPGVLLAQLSIGSWSALGRDDNAESHLADHFKCAKKKIRVTKLLMETSDCPELAKVKELERRARQIYRSKTLPWSDKGHGRLLKASEYTGLMAEMRIINSEMKTAWEDLINVYQGKINDMSAQLGSLFNASDYPTVNELRGQLTFDIEVLPLTKEKDVRLNIRASEEKKIKEEYGNMLEKKFEDAIRAPWVRIHEVISHMVERLDAKDASQSAKLYDSVIFNIADVAALLPSLNITDDPELDAMAVDLRQKFTVYGIDLLKDSPILRKELKEKGKKIINMIEDKLNGDTKNDKPEGSDDQDVADPDDGGSSEEELRGSEGDSEGIKTDNQLDTSVPF